MTRYLAHCAVLLGLGVALGATGPGHAQQSSPAPTQEQVEQPAPDIENLRNEDLNRTQSLQQLQDESAPVQVAEARGQADETLTLWQERLAEKPEAFDVSESVQDAWTRLRQAHSALMLADEETLPDAQAAFQQSAEALENSWTEAVD